MDPELQKKLAAILDYLLETSKQAVDFASDQLPLVAWEMIAYARAWHTVITVIAALVLLWWLTGMRKVIKGCNDRLPSYDKDLPWALWALCLIPINLTLFIQLSEALKAWFAPRVYLLEWAASLIKSQTR